MANASHSPLFHLWFKNNQDWNYLLMHEYWYYQKQECTYDIIIEKQLFNLSRSRKIILFLTGPFRSSIGNFSDIKTCRFCGLFEENSYHLLFICAAFDHQFNLSDFNKDNFSIFEDFIKKIVLEIYKF